MVLSALLVVHKPWVLTMGTNFWWYIYLICYHSAQSIFHFLLAMFPCSVSLQLWPQSEPVISFLLQHFGKYLKPHSEAWRTAIVDIIIQRGIKSLMAMEVPFQPGCCSVKFPACPAWWTRPARLYKTAEPHVIPHTIGWGHSTCLCHVSHST